MKPMKPMKPMEPMEPAARWWPDELGSPSSSGSQNGWRYAFFADRRRLVIDQNGTIATFDSGPHVIQGIKQSGGSEAPEFRTRDGTVQLAELRTLS